MTWFGSVSAESQTVRPSTPPASGAAAALPIAAPQIDGSRKAPCCSCLSLQCETTRVTMRRLLRPLRQRHRADKRQNSGHNLSLIITFLCFGSKVNWMIHHKLGMARGNGADKMPACFPVLCRCYTPPRHSLCKLDDAD